MKLDSIQNRGKGGLDSYPNAYVVCRPPPLPVPILSSDQAGHRNWKVSVSSAVYLSYELYHKDMLEWIFIRGSKYCVLKVTTRVECFEALFNQDSFITFIFMLLLDAFIFIYTNIIGVPAVSES